MTDLERKLEAVYAGVPELLAKLAEEKEALSLLEKIKKKDKLDEEKREQIKAENLKHAFCVEVELDKEEKWSLTNENIGGGAFGEVYQVCDRAANNCNYVMKIINLCSQRRNEPILKVAKQSFKDEVRLHDEASHLGVAPEIIDSWTCTDPPIGVIIMPLLKRTLKSILYDKTISRDIKEARKNEAEQLLKVLIENHISHSDVHLNNIMEGFDGKLYLIDFGKAIKFPKNDTDIMTTVRIPSDYYVRPCYDLADLCKKVRRVGWETTQTAK